MSLPFCYCWKYNTDCEESVNIVPQAEQGNQRQTERSHIGWHSLSAAGSPIPKPTFLQCGTGLPSWPILGLKRSPKAFEHIIRVTEVIPYTHSEVCTQPGWERACRVQKPSQAGPNSSSVNAGRGLAVFELCLAHGSLGLAPWGKSTEQQLLSSSFLGRMLREWQKETPNPPRLRDILSWTSASGLSARSGSSLWSRCHWGDLQTSASAAPWWFWCSVRPSWALPPGRCCPCAPWWSGSGCSRRWRVCRAESCRLCWFSGQTWWSLWAAPWCSHWRAPPPHTAVDGAPPGRTGIPASAPSSSERAHPVGDPTPSSPAALSSLPWKIKVACVKARRHHVLTVDVAPPPKQWLDAFCKQGWTISLTVSALPAIPGWGVRQERKISWSGLFSTPNVQFNPQLPLGMHTWRLRCSIFFSVVRKDIKPVLQVPGHTYLWY